MASIKKDPALSAADRAIRRINTDLKRAATLFGTQSSQYQTIESYAAALMQQAGADVSRMRTASADGQQYTQLPRTRSALAAWTSREAGKLISKIEKAADWKKQEKWMLERYKEQTGQVPKTAAQKRAAVREISDIHTQLNDMLQTRLDALYTLRAETGDDSAVQAIRQLSRGQWTTAAAKQEMIRIADEAIQEQGDIIDDFFDDIGVDLDDF